MLGVRVSDAARGFAADFARACGVKATLRTNSLYDSARRRVFCSGLISGREGTRGGNVLAVCFYSLWGSVWLRF